MNHIESLICELMITKFYGSVEIKFEAGKPVLLRKTETIKPNLENNRSTRGTNDHDH
jgi:hypothetical protein